jgi:hypothetical protein
MVKKILTLFVSTGLFAALGTANSCAPTAPNETSTTTLVSVPSSLALTRSAPSQNASIGLSCGCSFPLSVFGYAGDTSVIHFSVGELPDSTVHTVSAWFDPSLLTGSGVDSALIILTTPNDSVSPSRPGNPLYDTLRVRAAY